MAAAAVGRAQAAKPKIAITMDDFQWQQIPGGHAEEANRRLLDALARHSNLQAVLFVCGRFADNPTGRKLLQAWNDAGHWIGNHSYSHLSYNSAEVTFAAFRDDLLRGEQVLSGFPNFQKMFRFPFLHEGNTAEKRDQMRAFLAEHGYRNGHVTVDTSDWYYDQRLRARLKQTPDMKTRAYREPYLAHVLDRGAYYDGLARSVVGRTISDTILLHYTLLNTLFLDDVLAAFEAKGWELVPAKAAYQDPIFASAPRIVPAGESLVWGLAKESGKFEGELRSPGEDGEYEKEKLDRLGL